MKKNIQAVIFDCDGTLVDSEALGGRAMWEVAVRHGCMLDERTLLQACLGSNMVRSIAFIDSHSTEPMPEYFASEVRALMAEKFKSELTEIVGAKTLLLELEQRKIPFAVGTNGPRAKAELTLGLTDLLPFFKSAAKNAIVMSDGAPCPDRLFCAYEHDTFKPDPKLFLLAASALGVAPEHCAVIEDSFSGLCAGVAAGMQVFSLAPLDAFPRTLEPMPVEIARLAELLQYL